MNEFRTRAEGDRMFQVGYMMDKVCGDGEDEPGLVRNWNQDLVNLFLPQYTSCSARLGFPASGVSCRGRTKIPSWKGS